jgi:mono/diheme cytochrome c family protein
MTVFDLPRRFPKTPAVVTLAALALVAFGAESAAPRSVWDGVFSAAQVQRGKKGYESQCARCHGETLGGGEDSPALVDQNFLKGWFGKSVGHLVEYTREEMPSDGPGKLSRRQCTDVVAFLLDANGFPAGPNELDPDVEILNQIQITPKK